ncbi:MAG TPA: family 16 glycoside hydrolase [Polyangiaceae bacterium]
MKTRALRRMAGFSWIALTVVLGCAASATGNDTLGGDDEDDGTGGTSGTGGDTSTGGASSGSGGQGGTSSGGSTPTGGTSSGGSAPTGGTSSGGSAPTGGTSSGGSAPTGGTSSGGSAPTGGTGGTRPPPGRTTIPLPYTDDFETSMAADWRFISVPWSVMDDGGNKVLELSATGDSELTWAVGGDRNWTDVRVSMRVKFVSGEAMILLSPKWKDLDSYAFVEYEAEDKPKLRRRLAGSTADIVTAAETMTFTPGQWHTVAVTLVGNAATLEIDGTVIGMATDSTPVPNGGIGIAVENGIVAIDDVSVTVP